MKVELSIKDDSELRTHIKDVIKGQFVSIAREEITDIVKAVFLQKYRTLSESFEDLIKETIKEHIRKELDGAAFGKSLYPGLC